MSEHEHSHHASSSWRSFWTSTPGLVCIGFLAIGGAFLVMEHQAHVLGALPYVVLLACPLMHIFMHRGHGGHGRHTRQPPTDRSRSDSDGGRS